MKSFIDSKNSTQCEFLNIENKLDKYPKIF